MHDRDTKFTKSFNETLSAGMSDVKISAFRSPNTNTNTNTNTNAYVERFIQSLQQECLDHFVVFGKAHFDHLCSEYRAHYHIERPHQSLDNDLLVASKNRKRPLLQLEMIRLGDISCRQRLGGLLKCYSLKAA